METQAHLTEIFEVGQDQIYGHGYPYLSFDGIGGGSQEALDFKILFDPFEEDFDLPAFFVNVSNGLGG